MERAIRVLFLAGWLLPLTATADDTSLDLGAADGFAVRNTGAEELLRVQEDDGITHVNRLFVKPNTAMNRFGTVVVPFQGGLDHPLVFYRDDTDKVAYIFDDGGALRSNTSLMVDGEFQATMDENTGEVSISQYAFVPDPDNPGLILNAMAQIGNDIEFTLLLKTQTTAFPDGGALLIVDSDDDFRFQIDAQGRVMFGPDGESTRAALDVILERVENGGNDHLQLTTEGGDVLTLFQQANVAAPAGGSTVDVECRQAVDDILDLLEGNGLMAP